MGSVPRPWIEGPSCLKQHRDTIGVIFGGVYWDNGKKNGNYSLGLGVSMPEDPDTAQDTTALASG